MFLVQSVPVNVPVSVADIGLTVTAGSITKESSATFDSDADIDAALDAVLEAANKADINDDIVSFHATGGLSIQQA